MRTNLTKKEIVNSIYMKLGLSKRILDIVLEDILNIIVENLTNLKVKLIDYSISDGDIENENASNVISSFK